MVPGGLDAVRRTIDVFSLFLRVLFAKVAAGKRSGSGFRCIFFPFSRVRDVNLRGQYCAST